MEPRLRSRGSRDAKAKIHIGIRLQWSRGCEAAEALSLGADLTFDISLQWSRGCEAAEAPGPPARMAPPTAFNGAAAAKPRKRPGRRLLRVHPRPSMEPRLRSRGSDGGRCRAEYHDPPSMEPRKQSRTPDGQHDRVPSMEPRLRSRGSPLVCRRPTARRTFNGAAAAKPRKLELRGRVACPSRLQWSRGCEAAEATWGNRMTDVVAHLQWSRGCEAAEARTGEGRRRRMTTFNGAAAAKPRKPADRERLGARR